jgi:hypothetical protein
MARFRISTAGLKELVGDTPPERLAFEPIANVFDEFDGYGKSDRKRPTFCSVQVSRTDTGRKTFLTVTDDGAGFKNPDDIFTLFGPTEKRAAATVRGRFNTGEKLLIAVAHRAVVRSNNITVAFEKDDCDVTRHRSEKFDGVEIQCLMPWNLRETKRVISALKNLRPPEGLRLVVDGEHIVRSDVKHTVNVTLPTVLLEDGALRNTTRKCAVDIIQVADDSEPRLLEMGLPVQSLDDIGFRWSLDVQQKVPLPMSRDIVPPTYLFRLIGVVLEQAAMDGVRLIDEANAGDGFVKNALDWVRNRDALEVVVKDLCGEDAVRRSSDPIANAQAEAAGRTIVSGRWFTENTRHRMTDGKVLPTSKAVFGGTPTTEGKKGRDHDGVCPMCGK